MMNTLNVQTAKGTQIGPNQEERLISRHVSEKVATTRRSDPRLPFTPVCRGRWPETEGGDKKKAVRKCVLVWAPPLPVAGVPNMAAPQDVHVRICNQEIVKFDLEVKALIQDIRDCSGPLSALTELNTKVKEKFQQLRYRIQDLEQSAKEQDKESEKQLLLQEVENHKKQMLSNQTSWRKANLTCKIAIDNLEKAELLRGGELLRQRKTTKESLAQTSSTITESLMGISRMMSQQVQQSEEAMQTLGVTQVSHL
nr:vesicle transport protein SEC20 isoform X2 [Microcebus murinus]